MFVSAKLKHHRLKPDGMCARKARWSEGRKSPPGKRSPARSQEQLRRREARWGAAGGERPVRRKTNSIRSGERGKPAYQRRSLDRENGNLSS